MTNALSTVDVNEPITSILESEDIQLIIDQHADSFIQCIDDNNALFVKKSVHFNKIKSSLVQYLVNPSQQTLHLLTVSTSTKRFHKRAFSLKFRMFIYVMIALSLVIHSHPHYSYSSFLSAINEVYLNCPSTVQSTHGLLPLNDSDLSTQCNDSRYNLLELYIINMTSMIIILSSAVGVVYELVAI